MRGLEEAFVYRDGVYEATISTSMEHDLWFWKYNGEA
jgi:hypothetical protein